MDELRRYELYVVFQPELENEQLESHIDRINGYLSGHQGEIIEVARRGKRRLAYPINKFNQGIDVIYQVNLPGPVLETLERQLNLFEDVLRYLVVRRDDLDKAGAAASQPATATSEEPAEATEEAAGEAAEATEPTETTEEPAGEAVAEEAAAETESAGE